MITSYGTLSEGLHLGIPAERYHADRLCGTPTLSSGIARTLVNRSPAHARMEHPRLAVYPNRREPTEEMVHGQLVHAILAGTDGDEFEVGDNEITDFRGVAGRKWRDSVLRAGKTPILQKHWTRALSVVAAVRGFAGCGITRNPLDAGTQREVTALWHEDGGIMLRARFDLLDVDPDGQADIWDWKTAHDLSDEAIVRSIIDHGYHVQAAFYLRGLRSLLKSHAGRCSFIFGFVESSAPFGFRRVCLSDEFLALGNTIVERAVAVWRDCITSGRWPNFGQAQTFIAEPPSWYSQRIEERFQPALTGMTPAGHN